MRIKPLQKIWMDGNFIDWNDAQIHILTHGLHYGLAIFEGIRLYDTEKGPAFFRMKDHYERLSEGCRSYGFEYEYSVESLCRITKELVRVNGVKMCYIRPIVYTGYGEISPDMANAEIKVAICPVVLDKYFGKKTITGISCMVSSWRKMDPAYLSPHVKASANYLNSALAKKEAQDAGFDDSILLSKDGYVAEATGTNIFVVKNGNLITPPPSDGILRGITRDSVIKIAQKNGLICSEKSLSRDQLYNADEIFLCGTASDITPVINVDSKVIGNGEAGPITKAMKKKYDEIVNGRCTDFVDWLDFI